MNIEELRIGNYVKKDHNDEDIPEKDSKADKPLMSAEDRLLLIRDMYRRIPYGLHVYHNSGVSGSIHTSDVWPKFNGDNINDCDMYIFFFSDEWIPVEYFKPYLRKMSSMTKAEQEEYDNLCYGLVDFTEDTSHIDSVYKFTDWLDSHFLDYRRLIDKGLALEGEK